MGRAGIEVQETGRAGFEVQETGRAGFEVQETGRAGIEGKDFRVMILSHIVFHSLLAVSHKLNVFAGAPRVPRSLMTNKDPELGKASNSSSVSMPAALVTNSHS